MRAHQTLAARLGGRMARRLFALFVAAALAPLLLSDWVSSSAITQVAQDLHLGNHQQATRQASRQVLDRLLSSGALLSTLPDDWHGGPEGEDPPGLGRNFTRLTHLDREGHVRWSVANPEAAPMALPAPGALREGGAALQLLAEPVPGGTPRLLLVSRRGGHLRWVAELAPEHVWTVLDDSDEDARWWVRDGQRRTLLHRRGGENTTPLPDEPLQPEGEATTASVTLFLDGQLGAGSWDFIHQVPRRPVLWGGVPLGGWLALVALGTVLAVALVSHWRIRLIFQPLERLTAGTRALAEGQTGARVDLNRDDEIGELAQAFNDMAQRIETQLGALRRLAAIDHDILAGAPLEHIARHVTEQLSALYPQAGVALVWAGASTRSPAQSERLRQLCAQDSWQLVPRPGEAELADSPWLTGVVDAQVRWLVQIPLPRHGGKPALMLLGLAELPDPANLKPALKPALELRDRLAVALAARTRERELAHRATHDSLTGLVNRDGLGAALDTRLDEAGDARLALLFIDLDHFKDVNDSQGHEAGDDLLRRCAERLRGVAPRGATVARLGGDEFVLLLPGADVEAAEAVAVAALRSLARPLTIGDKECSMAASAGVALGPDHGRTRQELLRCADIALYTAKASGRGRHAVFDPAMDRAARERRQLVDELRLAVARREFVLHYQPRVRASDGRITSAEALVRWQHPQRGLLGPGAFIELAESSGLIEAIGTQVLDEACAQAAEWARRGLRLVRLSVNVSPQQLAAGDLPQAVSAALEKHGLPPRALEIEITESLLVDDAAAARAQLATLRQAGVTIALDDFGTGYSSLAVLRQLPIDVMKIDRAFVADLARDAGAMAVARAIVSLASSLQLRVVAEGVESEEQAQLLRALGCHELQGYHFSRPLDAERFAEAAGLRGSVTMPAAWTA
jgi:diguanylate cyclase (GGDEF)-like protein